MIGPERLAALDAAEAALLLGVTSRMLRYYVTRYGIPSEGKGRKRRFSWPAVRKWFVAYQVQVARKLRRVKGGGHTLIAKTHLEAFLAETATGKAQRVWWGGNDAQQPDERPRG
jgi:hypothetical protein